MIARFLHLAIIRRLEWMLEAEHDLEKRDLLARMLAEERNKGVMTPGTHEPSVDADPSD